MNTKLVMIIMIIILVLGFYTLFFTNIKSKKNKEDNLSIVLKAIGYTKESLNKMNTINRLSKTTNTTPGPNIQFCEQFKILMFGKNEKPGLNQVYKNIMGYDMPSSEYNCDRQKYTGYIIDAVNKTIGKGRNGFKDLVALYLAINFGILSAVNDIDPEEFIKINYNGNQINTIERKEDNFIIPVNSAKSYIIDKFRNATFKTPSKTLQSLDLTNSISLGEKEKEIMEKASINVNREKINELKNDTNPKMSIDTLGELINYSLSKYGFIYGI
jgi:hypothetical protein